MLDVMPCVVHCALDGLPVGCHTMNHPPILDPAFQNDIFVGREFAHEARPDQSSLGRDGHIALAGGFSP